MSIRSLLRVRLAVLMLAVSYCSIGCSFVGCNSQPTTATPAPASSEEPTLPPKTPKPLDLSYIPADAVFALVLDPHQLLKAPNFNLLSSSALPQLIHGDTGIEPNSVEQFILVGGTGKKLGEFFTGAIVRFKEPIDEQQTLAKFGGTWEKDSVGDRPYHRPTEPGVRSVFFADKSTLVTASEETLKKMLSAKSDAESPLLTTLRKADDAAAALMVLEMAQIRGQIMTFLLFQKLPAPFDKPPMDGVKELPKNIDELAFKFEVTPKVAATVTMQAKDEAAAKATDEMITGIITSLSESADKAVEEAEARGGGFKGAGATVMQSLVSGFESNLEHKLDGAELQLSMSGRVLKRQFDVLGPPVMQPMANMWKAADQAQSLENLNKIASALDAALAAQGNYPAPASYDADGKPLLSWRVHLLPLLGYKDLYDQFHLDEPWDSEHNRSLIPHMPSVYRTPGHPFDGKTDYLLVIGPGTVFEGKEGPKASVITASKSDTILAVEVYLSKGTDWTKPEDFRFDRADPTAGLTHVVKRDFLAAFADGTSRLVEAKDGNSAVVARLFTAAEDEPSK